MRVGGALKTVVVFGFALRLHHHFEGSPIDYYGVAAAAAASWIGVPGPGEPVLIAAGVLAAHDKLDIGAVILVAFLAAMGGGIGGWLVGMKLGRRVLALPGPLKRMRATALERGDEIFDRAPVLAIVLTPSWVAGIHHVRTGVYLLTNAVGAAVWAAGIGLAAYWIGPAVVDFVGDLGLVTGIGLVALIAAGVVIEVQRRRRHRFERAHGDD